MKTTTFLVAIFAYFTLISCSSGAKQDQTQEASVPPATQEQSLEADLEPVQAIENNAAEKASADQKSAEVMLNPPHGQPYHRCDIPVGAPLNSPPQSAPSQATNTQVQATSPQSSTSAPKVSNSPSVPTAENVKNANDSKAANPAAATAGEKPSLNPPHGQPFHRCDIPVGSPLP